MLLTSSLLGPVFWNIVTLLMLHRYGEEDYEAQEGFAFASLHKAVEALLEAFPQAGLQT